MKWANSDPPQSEIVTVLVKRVGKNPLEDATGNRRAAAPLYPLRLRVAPYSASIATTAAIAAIAATSPEDERDADAGRLSYGVT